jgi:hypothetical protein
LERKGDGLPRKMKKLVSILCILLIGISTSVFAQISDIINTRNEFGGETMMTPYSADDEEYKDGVAKTILYLNGNYKVVKKEVIRTDEYNKSSGIVYSISYFGDNEKVIKDEYFYNDNYALKKGIAKDVFYFDSNEKKVKAEAYDMNGLLVKSSQ